MANGNNNTFDVKGNAQTYGPKNPNKYVVYVNSGKKKDDKKPSLVGYRTDKDLNLFSVSLWKGKTKGGTVKFTGNDEDLGVKQNVVDISKPKQEDGDDILA